MRAGARISPAAAVRTGDAGAGGATMSVACMTAGPGARVAALLGLLRGVADEIVVAVDDRAPDDVLVPLADVADRLVLYPYAEPVDRPLPWLRTLCGGDWVFFLDDDEVPGQRLLDELPRLLRDAAVTHYSVPRRWLHPDPGHYLDDQPWRPDYALRLVRNDPRLVRFSTAFHRPIVALGAGRFTDTPVWHLDTAVRPFEARLAKADRYERLRPGMRVAGRALNHAFYVPELRRDARVAAVPEADRALIAAVLDAVEAPPPSRRTFEAERATREEIDALWHGDPLRPDELHARLELVEEPTAMVAGEQRTLDVRVHNLTRATWDWGVEGEPLVRLAPRWRALHGAEIDAPALRTHFPGPIAAGASDLVPMHLRAPEIAGRYRVELDLVHEFVGWFGATIVVEIDVRGRARIAVVGDADAVASVAEAATRRPEIELVALASGYELPSEPHGYERAPGLRSYLATADKPTGARFAARFAARTATVVAGAALARRSQPPRLPRGAGEFVAALGGCSALIVAGSDAPAGAAPMRELGRLVATAAAARARGLRVVVHASLVAVGGGAAQHALARTLRAAAHDVYERPEELAPLLGAVAEAGAERR